MRVLIAGLGSAGRRHALNLADIHPDWFVIGWHTSGQGAARVNGCTTVVSSLEEAMALRPEAAIVSCPSSYHLQVAMPLAAAGVHLLIEKPLADVQAGIDELIDLCEAHHLVLMVGYNFRFYEPLRVIRREIEAGTIGRPVAFRAEAARYLPDWRPGSDYRAGVSASRRLGGGVLLELSHELDYARWLLGEIVAVKAHLGRLGDLDIDVEDCADIILEFANGVIGSIHLDMLQRAPIRGCRVIGTDGTLRWDATTHHSSVYTVDSASWLDLHPARPININDMYQAELVHFFACVDGLETTSPTGEDGRRVVQLVSAIRSASTSAALLV